MENTNMKTHVFSMWPSTTNCVMCGIETEIEYSVPMYEGKIVDTSKTDDWAGFHVCKNCYDLINGEL